MPISVALNTEVRLLDSGYAREARSVLYHAYRHEPTFGYLLDSDQPGFDQRVRATVRELVNRHFQEDYPALGLMLDDRLVGLALIAPPMGRLGITESWAWRLRMVLTTGFACTRRFLNYQQEILSCLPSEAFHLLPLIGVHPQFQGRQLGVQLLDALHRWCADDVHSKGVVVDTGNPRYVKFYERLGYEEIGQIALGPVLQRVFLHPNPEQFQAAQA